MNSISDDNNLFDIWNVNSLVNTAFDGKQLGFYHSDIGGVVSSFNDGIIVQVDM